MDWRAPGRIPPFQGRSVPASGQNTSCLPFQARGSCTEMASITQPSPAQPMRRAQQLVFAVGRLRNRVFGLLEEPGLEFAKNDGEFHPGVLFEEILDDERRRGGGNDGRFQRLKKRCFEIGLVRHKYDFSFGAGAAPAASVVAALTGGRSTPGWAGDSTFNRYPPRLASVNSKAGLPGTASMI